MKQSKGRGQQPEVDEGDDYLDELGTAALVQYELTQRKIRSTSPFQDPVSHPHQFSSRHEAAPVGTSAVSEKKESLSLSEKQEYEERIKSLEEKGYEKEGEVTLLRSELKKRDDQIHELHMRHFTEQRVREEDFAKEKKALSTQLQFKEQELQFKEQELSTLREKCTTLQQKQKLEAQAARWPSSKPPQKQVSGETPGKLKKAQSEFLSTETFMPLSQMDKSDVTPVQVGHSQKRTLSQSDQTVEALDSRKQAATTADSATQSVPHVKLKGKDVKVEGGKEGTKPSSASPAVTPRQQSSVCTHDDDDVPIHLSVPPRELGGRDLLMLLAQRDLLKVPAFNPQQHLSEEEPYTSSAPECEAEEDPSSFLPGLFSLLHIPRLVPPSLSVSSLGLSTPSKSFLDSPPHSTGVPPLDLSPDSLPHTPTRKPKLQLHRKQPHTCARTDMTRSRTNATQEDFPLYKSLSASNTPIRSYYTSSEGEVVSRSLVGSVNVDSLQKSIFSLLKDEDSVKLSNMFSESSHKYSASTPFSSSSYEMEDDTNQGDSLPVEIQLLYSLGDIVVQYTTEQMERVRASAMSGANNTSHFSDLDSTETQSPRSSVGGSSTTSSRGSFDVGPPSHVDQSILCQSLGTLETLVTYSRRAREQLTMPAPPPGLAFDAEMSSVLESRLEEHTHSLEGQRDADSDKREEETVVSEEEMMEESEKTEKTPLPSAKPPKVYTCTYIYIVYYSKSKLTVLV